MFDFDELIDRTNTQSIKCMVLPEGCPSDALALWVADMDFKCAPVIIEALQKRINHGIFGYSLYETSELKEAICGWFESRFDWKIDDPRHIVYSPGVVPAISFLLQALSKPGDKIIIQRPVYYPFTDKIEASGRQVVNNPLICSIADNKLNYRMDLDLLDKQLADKDTQGMILCNPHNPVGRVWTEEELKAVLELAKKHKKWIISDEIHMDLTRKGIKHIPLLKIAGDYADQVIACTAPSKSFNLAGMQLSNIVIPNEEYRKAFLAISDKLNGVGIPNPFAISATIAAYTQGDSWLDALREYLDSNIALVEHFVSEHLPLAKIAPCEGTYLMWLDLRAYESDYKKLEDKMQHKAKLALDEGYIFGEEGRGFERINIASPRSVIEDALKRMEQALV